MDAPSSFPAKDSSLAPPPALGPAPEETPPSPRKRKWASGSRKRRAGPSLSRWELQAEGRADLAMAEKFDHLEEHLEKFVENIRQLGIIVSDFQPSSQAGLSQKL